MTDHFHSAVAWQSCKAKALGSVFVEGLAELMLVGYIWSVSGAFFLEAKPE